jgi:hypothetical protein
MCAAEDCLWSGRSSDYSTVCVDCYAQLSQLSASSSNQDENTTDESLSQASSEDTSDDISDSGSDFIRLIYGRANNFVDMDAPFLPATMTQVSRLWYLCCLVVILLI